jgi:hypothetical protein
MYSPLDLSMLHRERWIEACVWLQETYPSLQALEDEYVAKGQVQEEAEKTVVVTVQCGLCAYDGEHYFIEKSFQNLVALAAKSMPGDLEFRASWMLSDFGWLEFENPLDLVEGHLPRGIVTWMRIKNDPETGAVRFRFTFLPTVPPLGEEVFVSFGVADGDRFKDVLSGAVIELVPPGSAITLQHMLFATLQLMSQRIAVSRQTRLRANVESHARAQGIKVAGRPNIVMLRRVYEQSTHDYNSDAHREFSCQWVVDGHWREQPYRSIGTIRRIFIEAYIKGPKDKPLKVPSKNIFVARR